MDQSLLRGITLECYEQLCQYGSLQEYPAETLVFEEGSPADKFYLIESGQVDISIHKYDRTEHIAVLNEGGVFGEMAILNRSRRTASAKTITATTLLCVDQSSFLSLLKAKPELGERVRQLISFRVQELALKESVLDSTSLNAEHLHVSIKGDPSLRETVFDRSRYHSLVDALLPELIPNMEEMLLERNVYRLFINFNSGEIGVYTVFDPFVPETHAANKIVSSAYLGRHFPIMPYAEKKRVIGSMYSFLAKDSYLQNLTEHWQHLFLDPHKNWHPVPPESIRIALRELPRLRELENYYLRNFSINTVQDVMRMQFNCDGTHIVTKDDFVRFLDENI